MFRDILEKYVSDTGLVLSDEQFSLLQKYFDLVIEKNRVMNLTAITDEKEFVIKHVIDSLSIARLFSITDNSLLKEDTTKISSEVMLQGFSSENVCLLSGNSPVSVIDVGTGAGFPGMVLKIAFPKWNVTLFDSLQKRISFLQDSIAVLGLSDISAIHGRAEDFGKQTAHREQYSLCVSRAVANISTLSEYCLPFVSVGGMFVAYKSDDCDAEIENAKPAIELLGGAIEKVERFRLPDTEDGRSLVCVRKVMPTPAKYPRKSGIPSKKPL